MLEFLRFELRYRLRQPAVYLFALLFAAMTFAAATTDAVVIGGASGQTAIDSPYVITQFLGVMSVLSVLIVVAFTAGSVVRDFDMNTYSLFFTRPIRKSSYLLGRYFGGTVACMVVMLGAALGLAVGAQMPWLDSERLVGFSPWPYLQTLAVVVLPNLLIMGALFFCLATLTRRMLFAYVGVVAFFVIYGVSQAFLADLDNESVAALADPFGLTALELMTRYWTPAERNTLLNPTGGIFAISRAAWLGLAAAVMAFTMAKFKMHAPQTGARANLTEAEPELEPTAAGPLPTVHRSFGPRMQLQMCLHQTRTELRQVLRSTPFVVIALFAVVNVLGGAFGTSNRMYGTPVYPVTLLMVDLLDGSLALFVLIVLTFYAGEMIWRDRRVGLAEVNDALPVPNWVPLAAKLCALWAALLVLLAVGMATTTGFQLAQGYFRLELWLYATDLFGLSLSTWMILATLALFFQVLTNHKFAGYALMVVYYVSRVAVPAMGFEHPLYLFASMPPARYSDMNGYGQFLAPALWFRLYWGLAAAVLVLLANLFWVRGTDSRFALRLRKARQHLSRSNAAALAATAAALSTAGAYIFYNTNVLNDFESDDDAEDEAQRYEEDFKVYEALAQPRITAADLEADLYPDERRLEIRGTFTLKNKDSEPIDQLHVRVDPEMRINALGLAQEQLERFDEKLGYRIYRLTPALAPGAQMPFTFDLTFVEPGFKANGSETAIVQNGSFFHNSRFVPHFGYNPEYELSDPNERRERGLPERPRMAPVDDERGRKSTYISNEADWIDFSATISTSADQIALAPGYLTEQWREDGRRFFRYEMDAPILNLYAFLSADYEVARDHWNDVELAVYYHEPHDYNIARMIESMKKSLDYYTANFSPYQHRQLRIVEFPRYASFAQSLPNIVPYSESIGFIADLRDVDEIDYVFYVTAHEVAHQWWAHQVIGGNVQGSTLMSETLAQYSALMVMEKEYGRAKMGKFLRYELNRYLAGRAIETHRELPLMLVENQPYIHYNKGSLAMYALREYLGEDTVNGALREYLDRVAFQEPPYTNSVEFVATLRKATPEKYAYLVEDLFETITIYDNRTVAAKVTARDDGRYDVTIDLETHKYRADEKGAETEVDMNDWVQIGVFAATDDGEDDKPLYLEPHRIAKGQSSVTVTVDEEPARAGIDPNALLIDRDPDDNTRSIE